MNYYPEEFDKEDQQECKECGVQCERDYCSEKCCDASKI